MTKASCHESRRRKPPRVRWSKQRAVSVLKGSLSACHLSLEHLFLSLIHPFIQAAFCFVACSVRKWKHKSLPSHTSRPPPIAELKIPAGLPVITGRHIYLKGVVGPPPHRHGLYTPRQNTVWTPPPVTSQFQHSSHSQDVCRGWTVLYLTVYIPETKREFCFCPGLVDSHQWLSH